MSAFTNRERAWISLSRLFLDTDPSLFYDSINNDLVALGYSPAEVKEILIDEVAPALIFNLQLVAGEWVAFDDNWVVDRVREVKKMWIRRIGYRLSAKGYALKQLSSLMKRNSAQQGDAPEPGLNVDPASPRQSPRPGDR